MPCSSAGKQIRRLSIRLPAQTRETFRQFPPEFIPAFRVNGFVARHLPSIFSAPLARPAWTFRFPHFHLFLTMHPCQRRRSTS
jgi:hypothetical protein